MEARRKAQLLDEPGSLLFSPCSRFVLLCNCYYYYLLPIPSAQVEVLQPLKSCSRCLSASSMAIPRRRCETFVLLLLLSPILLAAAADEDDVRCLKGLRDSLSSPTGKLNWNFSNTTAGFVCSFAGVSCWNPPQENRVIDLSLPSMSLSGTIPSALQYCHAVASLDLSSNSLTGPIPSNLCDWLPYLVTLDLSSNSLSGVIPPDLSNCHYLNNLDLSSNALSGPIPASLSNLTRLGKLDLSSNGLSGPIPAQLSRFDSSSFANNPSLCGHPLSGCGGRFSRSNIIIITVAGVSGATASLVLVWAIWCLCFSGVPRPRRRGAMAVIP